MASVYQVTENADGRRFWTKIGVAWRNADGSIEIKLHALPLSGEMKIQGFY